ncbi:ISNCY family transposase, partial [Rhizobiaceae sp. 2RAB30]
AVRIMVRLLRRADTLIGGSGSGWHDHCRAAKKRAHKIQFTRGRPNRVELYRELIRIACTTLAYLKQAGERLAVPSTPQIAVWQLQV